ncbi:Plug domain-containing protein [Snuella lapsa]|uniref:Plug domain-containing protein n=1 Tax=Snuella lapsa TaxID=870481 RepID=A0ABP6XGU5_9FLAO
MDRTYYNAGDDLWFKSYVVDGTFNAPASDSTVVYVDIIDKKGSIIDSKITKAAQGFGFGDFKLAADLTGGVYYIRAYTNYMRNFDDAFFFRKSIFISPLSNNKKFKKNTLLDDISSSPQNQKTHKPDLQFFPEGGYLVNGFFNTIAFKAIDSDGKSIDISGQITDSLGTEVTNFKSTHLGMGALLIKPEKGKKYKATINFNGKEYSYKLPQTHDNKPLMQIKSIKDFYYLTIKTNPNISLEEYKIEAKYGNIILYDAKIKGNNPNVVLKIPNDNFDQGIIKFTLFNTNNTPVSERLVFNYNRENKIIVTASTNSRSYKTNQNIPLLIDLKQDSLETNTLEGTNFSVSITDIAASQPTMNQTDIASYLLLNSELKGAIEQPGYYFYSSDPKREQNLDLLMLTQGWRQYLYDDTPKNTDNIFNTETGITVSGTVKRFYNYRKTTTADVSLTYWGNSGMNFSKVKTDSNGKFLFSNANLIDGGKIVLQAKDDERPKNKYIIELAPFNPAPTNSKYARYFQKDSYDQFLNIPDESVRLDDLYLNEKGLIVLNEIELNGPPKSRVNRIQKVRLKNSIYFSPSSTVDFERLRNMHYTNLLDAIRGRVPGVDVFQNKVIIRGPQSIARNIEPLYLINGIPTDSSILTSIPANEVDFIDVIKGSRAAIFGSSGGGGVLAIYTIQGVEPSSPKDGKEAVTFNHHGFSITRKFYEPNYESKNDFQESPQSATLFWSPEVIINKEGQAHINFSSGTVSGTYNLKLEGLTNDGIPLTTQTSFTVE